MFFFKHKKTRKRYFLFNKSTNKKLKKKTFHISGLLIDIMNDETKMSLTKKV